MNKPEKLPGEKPRRAPGVRQLRDRRSQTGAIGLQGDRAPRHQLLDFHPRRRARRKLPGSDRPIDPQCAGDGAGLLRRRQQQRRDQEGAFARQPLPRAGASRSGSRTSSRATPSLTNCRRASGSTRSEAGTNRSTRLSAASAQLSGAEPVAISGMPYPLRAARLSSSRRPIAIAAFAGLLVAGCGWPAGGGLRPQPAAAHTA